MWILLELWMLWMTHFYYFFLFLKILFIFRARGREGEREGEEHQCVAASHTPPTGDLACNPGMCPDWESNQQPYGLQAGTQSTEPHQPGLISVFFWNCHNLVTNPLPSMATHNQDRSLDYGKKTCLCDTVYWSKHKHVQQPIWFPTDLLRSRLL